MGIKQQIQRAETAAEIKRLQAIGAKFENASDKTRRQWERAARR